ncbi:glycosyltransferase family 20-domain-containing protein [Bombardia bombarda]|uniref:Glycosyltransferase family 20-domain-containing protein n=1 Tax=Bombardia bombarda TaxID=252184 RepID=A0AA39U302_9PEZI|nr:glycosyltransferase family 20-domain-containing protein [Bombardia bombarda]
MAVWYSGRTGSLFKHAKILSGLVKHIKRTQSERYQMREKKERGGTESGFWDEGPCHRGNAAKFARLNCGGPRRGRKRGKMEVDGELWKRQDEKGAAAMRCKDPDCSCLLVAIKLRLPLAPLELARLGGQGLGLPAHYVRSSFRQTIFHLAGLLVNLTDHGAETGRATERSPHRREHDRPPGPQPVERSHSSTNALPPHVIASMNAVPVTPGIGLQTYNSGEDDTLDGLKGSISPGYFTKKDVDHAIAASPAPTGPKSQDQSFEGQVEAGADAGKDFLKRLSRVAMGSRRDSLSEIRATNPNLSLSGNIISATFTIPHTLKYRKGSDWELKPRRGQSALFDSFSYLSSDEAPWNHTVVAWTGEIETPTDSPSPPGTPPSTTVHLGSLNVLSAPVPIHGEKAPPTPPLVDGLWIAHEDMHRLEQQLSHDKKIKTVPVWLADEPEGHQDGIRLKDQGRWRRYAEHDLYTLLHYKQHEPTDGRAERVQWADYYRMNQKFANRILEIYKPGDIVIVHDYNLMLLPSMLRQRAPHMYISFYLHSPFPSSEFMRCLPRRKEILEGVLGSNLVGFQSYSFSRHFASCCTRILGFPSDTTGVDAYGSRVEVGVFPIGIDAIKVASQAFTDAVDLKYNSLKNMYGGRKMIVGRDRLDSVRGVAQKLMAFERFLEMYPEWREKVVLVQVTSPTNIEEKGDPENKIASRVNELVMKINGMYGSLGFSPVQHYSQYISQDEYFALLRAADIGLITSVRDGMNTTSLEYVICQRESAGPLILSEFSGTAGSLKDAIHINPWDLSGVAESINTALTMSEDRRQQMQQNLLAHVTSRNVQYWIAGFLRRLVNVLGSRKDIISIPLLDRATMLRRYRAAKKRLFMFDYDGTLTPIVGDPSAAIPSERVITSLRALAADHRNAVWIISGRDQEFLNHHLGHITELGFSAEHGSFMRHPGTTNWENLAEKFDMGWQEEVMEVFQKYTDKVPGAFIERKRCALTWHYRAADPEQGIHMSRECQKELETTVGRKWDVEVMTGKANLEVRPTFINKGEIAKRLVTTYNAEMQALDTPSHTPCSSNKLEFVLCMGDDFTDEDMFRALNGLSAPSDGTAEVEADNTFSVTVGASTKVTLARWHLLEAEDVVECVALLAGVGGGGGGASAGGVLSMGEVNLAALSAVEDKIPDGAGETA